ncbi:hypothetical protein EPUL_006263 [Erysiphe pulchra]|uniref:Uncharacterized protein n=1 Tax=Erysiphe pulchra TaxID=225359 RepID=A0A2S4PKH8_9PEZI|nr:hypothetical protein EPUL_006263 [Erysiphe pulchra]
MSASSRGRNAFGTLELFLFYFEAFQVSGALKKQQVFCQLKPKVELDGSSGGAVRVGRMEIGGIRAVKLSTTSKPLVERPIQKPTAPSKRPLPDRNSKNSSENTDNVNVFLPKELAEIIATRQRRERAWHVRLMICTTVPSNIDSTLANLIEDIEKEEAEAFKTYLRLAISNFAAADSSPSPPRVPIHTRPSNGSGNVKGKETDQNLTKKVAIATPRIILSQVPSRGSDKNAELPKTLQTCDNSWAIVARKGKKKARQG